MPESLASLKKISAAVLDDFKKAIAAQADFVAKTKATPAAETGTFKVIALTSDEDRQDDSTDQSKWNLKNFEANSVVLWAHDYYSLPVGIATKIGVQNGSSSQKESLHRPSSIRSRAKCPNSTKRVLSRQFPSVICNTRTAHSNCWSSASFRSQQSVRAFDA